MVTRKHFHVSLQVSYLSCYICYSRIPVVVRVLQFETLRFKKIIAVYCENQTT